MRTVDMQSWSKVPAEVLQIVFKLVPGRQCWSLRAVNSSWASLIRSSLSTQLVIAGDSSAVKENLQLALPRQFRYPQVRFTVKLLSPLAPLACIKYLQGLKHQAWRQRSQACAGKQCVQNTYRGQLTLVPGWKCESDCITSAATATFEQCFYCRAWLVPLADYQLPWKYHYVASMSLQSDLYIRQPID